RKLNLPEDERVERVIVPGYCKGDLSVVSERLGVPVEAGPKDVRDLPEMFGKQFWSDAGYGKYDIEIIAEINHASRLAMDEILAQAEALRGDGADVIDI